MSLIQLLLLRVVSRENLIWPFFDVKIRDEHNAPKNLPHSLSNSIQKFLPNGHSHSHSPYFFTNSIRESFVNQFSIQFNSKKTIIYVMNKFTNTT
jgi:hypothetical protein